MSDARILIGGFYMGSWVRHMLVREGFTCDQAETGADALRMIEQGSYEVAILTANMRWIRGWRVLELARGVRPELGVVIYGGPPIFVDDWRIAVVDRRRDLRDVVPETLAMFARRAARAHRQ